jgi:alkylated DNA repair dioxygenase AlkB
VEPLPSADPFTSDSPIRWPIVDGAVELWPRIGTAGEIDRWYAALRDEVDWTTEHVTIFGERRLVPRLVAWHGDPGATYRYSGTTHEPRAWTPVLSELRARIAAIVPTPFNSVLLNFYRNGADGMGWHADDEPELGRDPVIASVSLGEVRRFRLRHRRRSEQRLDLDLPHGSLLLMSGALQHHWLHALPKTRRPCAPRVNLTWRSIGTPRR